MASSIDNTTSETFPRDWEVYEKRIAELQAENQQLTTTIVELRKGLEPFARFAERIPNCYKSPKPHISNKLISYLFRDDSHSPSVQDVMNARALLQSTNPGEGLMEELGQLRGNVDACHEEMQRLTSELAAARGDTSEVAVAEIIAILAHYGQTRLDGSVYLTHPAMVAASVDEEFKPAAWLHDVLEDSAFTEGHLLAAGIEPSTISAVKIVSRDPDETYTEFIDRIVASKNITAITVKLVDIQHNLHDAGCPESLAKRYRPAIPILERAIAAAKGEK
jgi:hypothetical protein